METSPGKPAPRRIRCQNCFTLTPKNTKGNQQKRFCSNTCRYEFNRHGSAFGPLKSKIEAMIRIETRPLKKRIVALENELLELKATIRETEPGDRPVLPVSRWEETTRRR